MWYKMGLYWNIGKLWFIFPITIYHHFLARIATTVSFVENNIFEWWIKCVLGFRLSCFWISVCPVSTSLLIGIICGGPPDPSQRASNLWTTQTLQTVNNDSPLIHSSVISQSYGMTENFVLFQIIVVTLQQPSRLCASHVLRTLSLAWIFWILNHFWEM